MCGAPDMPSSCAHKLLCKSTSHSLAAETTHIEPQCVTGLWGCKHCKDARQSIQCCAGPFLSQQRSWRRCLQCGSMKTFRGLTTLQSPPAYCKMSSLMLDALVLHRCATTGWQLMALTNTSGPHLCDYLFLGLNAACTFLHVYRCMLGYMVSSIAAHPSTCFATTECGHTKSTFSTDALHCQTAHKFVTAHSAHENSSP